MQFSITICQKVSSPFALGCTYQSLPFRLQLEYQKYPYWSPSSEEKQVNKISSPQQHGPCCYTWEPVLFLRLALKKTLSTHFSTRAVCLNTGARVKPLPCPQEMLFQPLF